MLDANAYPQEFTQLMAGVLDTATKAITQPDPVYYIEAVAVSEAQELRRLRQAMPANRRRHPSSAGVARCEFIRIKIIRDLSLEIVESFARLQRAQRICSSNGRPLVGADDQTRSRLRPSPSMFPVERDA